MKGLGKIAAVGMAGTALLNISMAVGTTSLVTTSVGSMTSTRAVACEQTSGDDSDDAANGSVDKYISEAQKMADDDKIGYSQAKRQLNPDVDCSSFVFYALLHAGFKIGDEKAPFNTSTMDEPLKKAGFEKHQWDKKADSLKRGDILWVEDSAHQHTEIYIGNGKTIGAHDNYDGKDGDSKGDEVSVVPLKDEFSHYYRLTGSTSDTSGSDDSSTSGKDSSSDFKPNDNAVKIAKEFAAAGVSKAATAGVLGNLSVEAPGFDPKATNGSGYGLGQWTPRSKIRTWMDANGLKGTDDSDLDGQVKMLVGTMKSEFQNDPYLSRVKGEITVKNNSLYDTWHDATDPETAAVAWMAGYERPSWDARNEDGRKQVAREYYDKGLDGISFDGSKDDSDKDGSSSKCCTNDTSDDDTEAVSDTASSTVSAGSSVQEYTDKYGQAAFDIGKKYGLPYEAILGQSSIESGWGKSTLTSKYHNFFGIKAVNGQKSVNMPTKECGSGGCYDTTADFAVYDSDADGFAAYGKFIRGNPRYARALQKRTDPHGYIQELRDAGYATDNNYVSTVWGRTQQFIKYIKETNKFPPSSEVDFDEAPPSDSGSSSSDEDSDTETASCAVNDSDDNDEGSATNGEIGGAPTNTNNFGWMCNSKVKVCKNGDTGPSDLWSNGADYQCYWYWLMRSYMVFGSMENPRTMYGGDLYADLQGRKGWTTSKTPKPGAGVSFKNGGSITHVAFVEKVKTESNGKWKIFISEGNADGSGSWNSYATRWVDDKWAGWIQGFFWRTEWKL